MRRDDDVRDAQRWRELVSTLGWRDVEVKEVSDVITLTDGLCEALRRNGEKLRASQVLAEAAEQELADLHDQLDTLGEGLESP